MSSFFVNFVLANLFFINSNVARAATYYVALSGNNTNSCESAKNISTPKRTIHAALSCLAAGDTLYIRGGTYTESFNSNVVTIPIGTSWSAPVTIAGYPGERVVLNPYGSSVIGLGHAYIQYVIFDNLHLDGTNLIRDTNSTNVVSIAWGQVPNVNHIKIMNSEVYNSPWNGLIVGGSDIHLINLDVHDNGWWTQQIGYGPGANGAYLWFSNSEVVGGKYYRNLSYGIRVFDSASTRNAQNNVVRDTTVFANGNPKGGGGIVLGDSNNMAYNNIIYGNFGWGVNVIEKLTLTTNTRVYNNTLYNNSYGIWVYPGTSSTKVINNILFQSGTIGNNGVNSDLRKNFIGDPKFMNAAAQNFKLQLGSPSIDDGISLINEVPKDIAGTSRPQGVTFDIGAYEFVSGAPAATKPSAPKNLRVQ
jgi:parallel beta-helix repeat protein